MAKKSSSLSAIGSVIVLCFFAVAVIALANAMTTPPEPEPPVVENSTQTEQGTSSTSDTASEETSTDTSSQETSDATDSSETNVTSTEATTDTSTDSVTSSKNTSTNTSTNTSSNQHSHVSKNDTASFAKTNWYMLLTNGTNPLPENYKFEEATVYSAGRNWIVDARCAEDMKAMIAAAKKDGVSLIICSAYRSYELQEKNFNTKVQSYINKGYSKEDAVAKTATIIAVPGTSEHHTGLAADIVTPTYQNLNSGFEDTEAFKWLYANCAEFGFVLRYPKDKVDVTKIIYEPWHYRYVGKEAAQIMMSEGICFEEFLAKYGT